MSWLSTAHFCIATPRDLVTGKLYVVFLIFNHRGFAIRIYTRESSAAAAIDYFFSVENRAKVHPGGAKIEYGPFFSKTVAEAALDPALFNQALEDMREFACDYVDRLISHMPSEG